MESSLKQVQEVKEEVMDLQENQTVSSEMVEEEKTEPTPAKRIKMEDFPEDKAPIFMLKEKLLAKIFSYLKLWDLINVDKVCWLFRNIADQYFYRKMTFLMVDGDVEGPKDLVNKLERFGAHVPHLIIRNVANNLWIRPEHLNSIWTHCTEVQELSFVRVNLTETSPAMKNVFKSVTCLNLTKCEFTDEFMDFIGREFTSLEILRIIYAHSPVNFSFLPNLKDQLKELNLHWCFEMEVLNSPHFATFCQDNSTLEFLCFYYTDYYEDLIELKEVLKIIGNLKNLKKLEIQDVMKKEVPAPELEISVPDLPKLAHLMINSKCFINYYPFLSHLGDQDSLETFIIADRTFNSTLPGFDKILCKFTKIKLLKFYVCHFEDSHLSWIKCRGSLEHFKVKDSHVTDKGMLEFVQECPQLKILDLRCITN